jgi:hypothetical protein
MSSRSPRKDAADRAAIALLTDASHEFQHLLVEAITSESGSPKSVTTRTRVRDCLQGLSICIDAVRHLVAGESVDEAAQAFEHFFRQLAAVWDRGDVRTDAWSSGRWLLSDTTRSAYRAFMAGDDAAFERARAQKTTAAGDDSC